jgi:hypothetical protein
LKGVPPPRRLALEGVALAAAADSVPGVVPVSWRGLDYFFIISFYKQIVIIYFSYYL